MRARSFLSTAIVAVAGLSSIALADTTLMGHNLNSSTGLGTGNRGGFSHRFWESGPVVNSATALFTGPSSLQDFAGSPLLRVTCRPASVR